MSYKLLMMSDFQNWATPQSLVQWIETYFSIPGGFDLDVCATSSTAKCEKYFTAEDNALTKNWKGDCWMNPPYNDQETWLNYAWRMSHGMQASSVYCLIPARTDTKLFHDFIMKRAHAVYFIKGRINFQRPNRTHNRSSTHPSMLVIFKRTLTTKPTLQSIEPKMHLLDIPSPRRRGKL